MPRFILPLILSSICLCQLSYGTSINGVVTDKKTKEPLIGSTVLVKELNTGTSISLSGTYRLSISKPGKYTLICSFIGYHSEEKEITINSEEKLVVDFALEENANELAEIVVQGVLDKTTDEFALHTEKNSESIVNVMSAKTIQLMPDITVANLLQRFSGVSVDRNSSGDAQNAIIRGMPQRYNYTLVNGIKIPSPDDKNRYVPMDLFPSDLLDRLEVIKSLTPSMEGDATGGAMNLVMKDAPATLTVNASAATGTNTIAAQRGFSTFSGWQEKAPAQTHAAEYLATPYDFSYKNFQYYNAAPVNQVYNFSIGDRLTKDKKLGAIVAASYQDLYRATNSIFFKPENQASPGNLPTFDDIYVRHYSNHQKRFGAHLKADYRFNEKNQLKLYAMFVGLDEIQYRHTIDTVLGIGGRIGFGTGDTHVLNRSRVQQQKIGNVTLQGDHNLTQAFRINWSAVYSKASNSIPDWSEYDTQQGSNSADVPHLYSFERIWLNNYDQDYTGYLNLYYNKNMGSNKLEISAGGLYRNKMRDCKYYDYQLTPLLDSNAEPLPFPNGTKLGPDQWAFNNGQGGDGSVINPNTYTSHERIAAAYIQGKLLQAQKWEIIGGVRAEHTYQDWVTPMPLTFPGAYGSKAYLDILPSLNVKYRVTSNDNLRVAYFKSINRPGFFEIVPTEMPSDYFKEAGNPYLKHATIDNVDLRYEKFTRTLDQISFGIFYKHILNPIEQLWHKDSTSTSGDVIGPANASSARNFGAEIALTKYWGRFGISGNYTYTNSQVTTAKLYAGASMITAVSQTRPLQGQSPHIANLSLLYKDVDHGFNLQWAMTYTGTRITFVSPYQNLDYWQEPLVTMDFSLEKHFSKYFSFYLKAQNLLNSPYQVYIHHPNIYGSGVNELPLQYDKNKILVQREYYGQNFIAGFRFKFSR